MGKVEVERTLEVYATAPLGIARFGSMARQRVLAPALPDRLARPASAKREPVLLVRSAMNLRQLGLAELHGARPAAREAALSTGRGGGLRFGISSNIGSVMLAGTEANAAAGLGCGGDGFGGGISIGTSDADLSEARSAAAVAPHTAKGLGAPASDGLASMMW